MPTIRMPWLQRSSSNPAATARNSPLIEPWRPSKAATNSRGTRPITATAKIPAKIPHQDFESIPKHVGPKTGGQAGPCGSPQGAAKPLVIATREIHNNQSVRDFFPPPQQQASGAASGFWQQGVGVETVGLGFLPSFNIERRNWSREVREDGGSGMDMGGSARKMPHI